MILMVNGACGHMGTEMMKQIRLQFPDAEIIPVDACDTCQDVYHELGQYTGPLDCIVDFSHHSATKQLTEYAVSTRTPLVIATTGQTAQEREMIDLASQSIPVFLASNFSLGIAVLVRIAKTAAKAFPNADIEIVEVHHNRKIDVPSGTALTLAKAIRSVREDATLHIGRHENGKREKQEIGIHSLRMGNVPGIHEIHICTPTQTLTLKHETHDRALFAEGAAEAVKFLLGKPAGLYDMESMTSTKEEKQ